MNNDKEYISLDKVLQQYYLKKMIERENTRRRNNPKSKSVKIVPDDEYFLAYFIANQTVVELIPDITALEGSTLSEKIKYLSNSVVAPINYSDFAKTQKKYLFKILDIILGNSKRYLKNESGKYSFREIEMDFIEFILEFYHSSAGKSFLKGNYSEIDEEYQKIFYTGLAELAKNPTNLLDLKTANNKLDILFHRTTMPPIYEVLMEEVNNLSGYIQYYAHVYSYDTTACQTVIDKLQGLSNEICNLSKQISFPDIDLDALLNKSSSN